LFHVSEGPSAGAYASPVSGLRELASGLWRWTALHPEFVPGAKPESPADWPEEVGSVLYNGEDATVLIDPLLPAGDDGFLGELDARVRGRGLPASILTTIKFHRRSRDELARRYSASTSRAKAELPAGVESVPISGAGETMFWIPAAGALVTGDRIMGSAGGRLRVCPESWLRYLSSGITLADLAMRLRPLLDLPIESILVSHGEPVLTDGRAALADALDLG
jgi:glyoxylase-like metal-dependent hydrolase (beta-lactamase superfamily II)